MSSGKGVFGLNRDYLRRYLLLILVLIICAGVAWYLTNMSGMPADDAVLAKKPAVEKEVKECESNGT